MLTQMRLWPLLGVGGVLLSLGACSTAVRDQGAETAPEGLSALPAGKGKPQARVDFQKEIRPILESKCVPCHSGTAAPRGFRLDSRAAAFAAGAGGARIIPGHPEKSLLLAISSTHQNVAVMPVVGNRLTARESERLAQWISEGAHWPSGREGQLSALEHEMKPE